MWRLLCSLSLTSTLSTLPPLRVFETFLCAARHWVLPLEERSVERVTMTAQ